VEYEFNLHTIWLLFCFCFQGLCHACHKQYRTRVSFSLSLSLALSRSLSLYIYIYIICFPSTVSNTQIPPVCRKPQLRTGFVLLFNKKFLGVRIKRSCRLLWQLGQLCAFSYFGIGITSLSLAFKTRASCFLFFF